MGHQVEGGTPIRITRRIVVGSKVIQPYHCGIQYKRNLKDESQVVVQVVLLTTLMTIYQGCYPEEVLKYGGRDISESSKVSSRSKGGLAWWRTTTFIHPQTTNFAFLKYANTRRQRKSVRQSSVKGDYIVMRCSLPLWVPKTHTILVNVL